MDTICSTKYMTHSLTADAQPRSVTGRMVAVKEMAQLQRMLFEIEREFVRTATTLVYRVGDVELKYLICQHVWESAGHARFLRERGRELSGFGKDECVSGFLSGFETRTVGSVSPLSGNDSSLGRLALSEISGGIHP